MKLKKGDTVAIVSGKDKGKKGAVERVFSKENKALVTGVNQYKRHMKGRASGQASEIVTITKPLPVANMMFLCPKCKKQSRLGFSFQNSKKIRICKQCEEAI